MENNPTLRPTNRGASQKITFKILDAYIKMNIYAFFFSFSGVLNNITQRAVLHSIRAELSHEMVNIIRHFRHDYSPPSRRATIASISTRN